jgi:hypothetical protein
LIASETRSTWPFRRTGSIVTADLPAHSADPRDDGGGRGASFPGASLTMQTGTKACYVNGSALPRSIIALRSAVRPF